MFRTCKIPFITVVILMLTIPSIVFSSDDDVALGGIIEAVENGFVWALLDTEIKDELS